MKDSLVILGFMILCFELYRLLRGIWIRRFLKKKKEANQSRNPLVMNRKAIGTAPRSVRERKWFGKSMINTTTMLVHIKRSVTDFLFQFPDENRTEMIQ